MIHQPTDIDKNGLVLLIVEDDPALNRLIRKKLERSGYTTTGAGCGADCITRINQEDFNLMILDYRLPDMNGGEVIEELERRGTIVPFIVATGNGDQHTAVEMMKCGARHYMVKDSDFLELLPGIVELTLQELHREKELSEAKKLLENQLRQAQKMESIGFLAGGVAHDFNNLLTVIHGCTEMALFETASGSKLYHNLVQVQRAAERATGLTRQLLLFSRTQKPVLACIDVKKTLLEMVKMIHRLIGEDITVSTVVPDEPYTILADAGNIEQVIMNLTVNARDAMPDGGNLTFTIAHVVLQDKENCIIPGSRPGEFVTITVSDTGCGMDNETIQRIFEPFFTTKGAEKGTGLGLSVIYGIVTQHQGWIQVDSRVGYGTTFNVFLPSDTAVAEEIQTGTMKISDLMGNGEKILVVEDDSAIREWCVLALEECRYSVIQALNATEGLAAFKENADHITLVISDVVMPELSGFELAQHITSLKPHVPVILMSGYPGERSGYDRINETGHRFLQKPFTMIQLLQTVKQALGQSIPFHLPGN